MKSPKPTGEAIRRGVKPAGRKALLEMRAAHDKSVAEKQAASAVRLAKKLQTVFSAERAALAAEVRGNRSVETLQAEFSSELESLITRLSDAADDNEREGILHKELADQKQRVAVLRPVFQRAYQRIIDDDHLNCKLLPLLGKSFVFRKGSMGGASYRAFNEPVDDGEVAPTGEVEPSPSSFVLTAPYDDGGVNPLGALIHVIRMNATPDDGRVMHDIVTPFAGGAGARALVGSFVTIPSGFSRLQISARVRCNYKTYALSMLGVSSASTQAIVEVLGPVTGANLLTQAVSASIAPIAWFQQSSGDDTFFVSGTVDIPDTGGEFMIRAGVSGATYGAGNGAIPQSLNFGTVEQISVAADS